MICIEGEYFTIEKKGSTYFFTGDMLTCEYSEVTGFLEKSFKEVTGDRILFDFEKLNYLNTRGMSALCHAIAGLPEHQKVKIVTNDDITWQEISVEGIALICPGKIEGAEYDRR